MPNIEPACRPAGVKVEEFENVILLPVTGLQENANCICFWLSAVLLAACRAQRF
jgi:hypothetical protein